VAQPPWPLRALGLSGALWPLVVDRPLKFTVPYAGAPYSRRTQTQLVEDAHAARAAIIDFRGSNGDK